MTSTDGWMKEWVTSIVTVNDSSLQLANESISDVTSTTLSGDVLSTNITEYSSFSPNEMTSVDPDLDDVFLPWNNPYNIISLATFQSFEKLMTSSVSMILFLIGAPTNVLNCLVFYRQGLRDRMNLCLFCLAMVDLLFVTFFYLVSSYEVVGYVRPDLREWWKYFTRKYFTGLYRGFLYSSGCLTAVIAVERCVCVMLPHKFTTLIRTRTMAIIIFVIVGCLQLAALLYPLQLQIGSRTDPVTGKTNLFLSSTQFYTQHKLLYTVVEDTLLMVVIPFGTFIIVVISTAVTVLELKLRMRWREASSSATSNVMGRQQVAVVKMLVMVSCIYILTAAPNVALGLARSFVPEFRHTRRYANIFLASHLLYLMLTILNCSINFFVYVTRSSRFRAELVKLCSTDSSVAGRSCSTGNSIQVRQA